MLRTPFFKFGSHLPVLIKVMTLTDGPVLEMGMGFNSSTVLHWMCAPHKRELVSYENDLRSWDRPLTVGKFECDFHKVIYTKDWLDTQIERPWDVAFLDQGPAIRRKEDIKRLANFAKYIVIHDSEGRMEKHFHYHEIFPLFKWQYNCDLFAPKTSVLSNFIDLTHFNLDYEN